MKLRDLLGQRFGRLLVLSKVPSTPRGGARWHVRCDCGNNFVVQGRALTYYHPASRHWGIRSCGCLRREQMQLVGRNADGTFQPNDNVECVSV